VKFDLDKYLNLYLAEAKDHLENASKILENIEEQLTEEKINNLFREAHSLKGMSAAMGFNHISELAHQMENLIDRIRKGEIVFSRDVADSLLEYNDKLWKYVLTIEKEKGMVKSQDQSAEINGLYIIKIIFKENTPSLNARAFLIYKNIESFGKIIRTEPHLNQIKTGELKNEVVFYIQPTKQLNILNEYLKRVSEINSYTIEQEAEKNPEEKKNIKDIVTEDKPELPRTIKVDVSFLDYFLNISGELITLESRLRDVTKKLDNIDISNAINQMEILLKDIQEKVMRLRLMPLEVIFSRIPMWIRDLTRKLNKKVSLKIEGENIELDRSIVESLIDPLLHIIRNSIDHGIETPQERVGKGKPEEGKLLISATKERDRIKISVVDDGRGIDAEKVLEKARKSGKFATEYLNSIKSKKDILYLVTFPGISTKQEISEISGRGVGLDVVKAVVESFGGTFEIDSSVDKGTELSLFLPTSISIINVLFFKIADYIFGTPVDKIIKVAEIDKENINSFDESGFCILYDYEYIPLYFLSEKLNIKKSYLNDRSKLYIIIVSIKGTKSAVVIDEFYGHKEVYLRPLTPPLSYIPGYYSSTILGDGTPILILDIQGFY